MRPDIAKRLKLTAKLPRANVAEEYDLVIYDDGRIYLDQGTESIMVVAPMASDSYEEGYVFIKDYSENAGILKILVEEGIVEDTGVIKPVGYAALNIVKLLK